MNLIAQIRFAHVGITTRDELPTVGLSVNALFSGWALRLTIGPCFGSRGMGIDTDGSHADLRLMKKGQDSEIRLKTLSFGYVASSFFWCLAFSTSVFSAANQPNQAEKRITIYPKRKVSPKTIRTEALPRTSPEGHSSVTESPPPEEGSSGIRFGLGFSTLSLGETPILSLMGNFAKQHQVQVLLGIDGTSPFTFQTGLGYLYEFGNTSAAGVHLGGLVRMSLTSAVLSTSTTFSFAPLLGIHFELGQNTGTRISLDGGPDLRLTNGLVDFKLKTASSALGLSVHQFF